MTTVLTLGLHVTMIWLIAAGFYLAVVNLATYAAFETDKHRAINGGWRLPERMLLGLALFGGSIGAVAAQRRLRHKTLKQPFASELMMIVGLQAGLAISISAFGIAQSLI